MNEIRTTKIDGQEFVTLTDYHKLKEKVVEKSKLYWGLMDEKERYSRELGMMTWKNNLNIGKIKELEEENKKLKEEKQELEYLGDINEELEEENKKLKERIKELEATNKKRTADNWATFKS